MEQESKINNTSKNWKTVILHEGEGEKILFRIGLMTVKVSSSQANDQFMICETVLPPGASIDPHSHAEAETFYILEGEFTFLVEGFKEAELCKKGAFVSVPPHVNHGFRNSGTSKGKILGTITPGGAQGLESLFRNLGVKLAGDYIIPDLDKPVEHLLEEINRLRSK